MGAEILQGLPPPSCATCSDRVPLQKGSSPHWSPCFLTLPLLCDLNSRDTAHSLLLFQHLAQEWSPPQNCFLRPPIRACLAWRAPACSVCRCDPGSLPPLKSERTGPPWGLGIILPFSGLCWCCALLPVTAMFTASGMWLPPQSAPHYLPQVHQMNPYLGSLVLQEAWLKL